jgi:hypothetical protein
MKDAIEDEIRRGEGTHIPCAGLVEMGVHTWTHEPLNAHAVSPDPFHDVGDHPRGRYDFEPTIIQLFA